MSDPTTASLTTCDDEQIHLLGAIQDAGYLLAVDTEWAITRASANAAQFFGSTLEELLGRQIDDVISAETMHTIRNRLFVGGGADTVERLLGLPLPDGKKYDIAVHAVGRETVLEIEPSGGDGSAAPALLRSMINRLQSQRSMSSMFREAARQTRALIGFKRVMVYRFNQDGSGEVVAESLESGLQPYLGQRYPASDIPRQARALYERNLIRIIFDVDAKPVPILPELSVEGVKLDLSMSVLRSVSPVHLEYLRNMGVTCSMSISILQDGKLWGLIACHHHTPTHLSLEVRTAAELFGQMFSYALEVRQRQEDTAYDRHVHDIHNRIATAFSVPDADMGRLPELLIGQSDYIQADGVGVYHAQKVTLNGITPTEHEFQQLVKHLNRAAPGRVFATDHLSSSFAPAADYPMRAAGILCIPISRTPRDYLIFFRRNIVKVMNWAGEPVKTAEAGPNGVRLTPRKSFEAWREIVEDKSEAWKPREMRAAEGLRVRLVEQVLRMSEARKDQRVTADQRSEILIAELNHRIRNILGLVRALVKQTASSSDSVAALVENVDDRIRSLARAYDLLTVSAWQPAPLRDLLNAELESFGPAAKRVTFSGPDVILEPRAFSTLALVTHELATNAAKYGALATTDGRIDINVAGDALGNVILTWRESGGPPVAVPVRRSFGTTILEQAIGFDLGGVSSLNFAPSGLVFEAMLPAAVATRSASHGQPQVAAVPDIAAIPFELDGLLLNCLILEDNLFIAMDAEDTLRQLGAKKVTIARSVAQALSCMASEKFTFAILDVNLGAETSLPVARALRAAGVLFAFGTGYGDGLAIVDTLSNVPVIAKPYHPAAMSKTLSALAAQFAGTETAPAAGKPGRRTKC